MPTLCLVEESQLRTETVVYADTVTYEQRSEKHQSSSSHTDVHCSISAKFFMMIEDLRASIAPL